MSDYPPRPEDYTDPEEYVEAVLRWIYRHTGSKASELDNHTLSQQIAMVAARVAIGGVFDLQTGEDLQNLAVVSKDLAFFDNPEVPLLLRLQINALGLEIANVLDK